VLSRVFNPLEKRLCVPVKRHASLVAIKGGLAQCQARLNLLRHLLGRLLPWFSHSHPLRLAGSLMIEEDPPGPFPLFE